MNDYKKKRKLCCAPSELALCYLIQSDMSAVYNAETWDIK